MKTLVILGILFIVFTLLLVFGCLKGASRLSREEEKEYLEKLSR